MLYTIKSRFIFKLSRFLLCFAVLLLLCFAVPKSANALNFGRLQTRSSYTQVRAVKPFIRAEKLIKQVLARVTVYWPKEDHWSRRHKSSTGIRLQRNAVAVDPHIIPYGSRIKFPDAVCHAIDTGSAVKSRRAARKAGRTVEEKSAIVVDRFFETKREALAWAAVHPLFLALDILPPERTF